MKKDDRAVQAHAARAHDRFSPSGADRWLVCPGSVLLVEKLGCPDTSNAASELGTAAHELLEASLKAGKSPEAFRGKVFNKHKADDTLIEPVDQAFDYIRSFVRKGAKLYTEHEVTVPGVCKGHLDAAVVDGRTLHVFDYKNGRHLVRAAGNNQMRLYAVGMVELAYKLKLPTFDTVWLHIVQPNANPEVGDAWKTSVAALAEWVKATVLPAAKAILDGSAEYDPTSAEACKWCPARGRCKPYAEHNAKMAGADWADTIKGKPKCDADLTPKEIAGLVGALPAIAQWAKAVLVEAMRLARSGKLPGFKVVGGKPRRAWTDEALPALVKKLGNKALAEPKLRGVTILEKLLKDPALMKRCTTMRLGGPQLADKSDPRPAYTGDAALDFEDDLHQD